MGQSPSSFRLASGLALCLLIAFSAWTGAAPAAEVRVAGRVLDAADRPIEGVVVEIVPTSDSLLGAVQAMYLMMGAPDPQESFPSVTSDSEGRFELAVWGSEAHTLARRGCDFQLRLRSPGHTPLAFPLGVFVSYRDGGCRPSRNATVTFPDPLDRSRILLPVAKLTKGRSVKVRVFGPDGEPASGAWVKSYSEETPESESDETGGWRPVVEAVQADKSGEALLTLRPGRPSLVTAYVPGLAPGKKPAPANLSEALELRLRPTDRQRLRVLSPPGPPLSDAGLCLEPGAWCVALTDVDGLATLERDAEVTGLVIRSRFESWSVELPARSFRGDEFFEIDLGEPREGFDPNAGPSLVGRVLNESSTPLESAEVYRLGPGHSTTSNGRPKVGQDAMARADLDGFFQIAAAEEDRLSIEVWADDHLTERLVDLRANVAADGGEIGPELEITLRRATRLDGVVRTATGEPLAGAELAVFDPDGGFSMSYPRAVSGADGTFSLTRIDPTDGGLVLFASHQGHVTRQIPWYELPETATRQTDPGQPAEIVLEPSLTLRGRVVDPEGEGVAGAELGIARGSRSMLLVSATSGPEGAFELAGLPSGSWDVKVEHSRYERSVHQVDLTPESAARAIELRLEPAESYDVRGRLRGNSGNSGNRGNGAVAGIELALLLPDGTYRRTIPLVTTDAAGAFVFEDVRPGTYEIGLTDDPRIVAAEDKRIEVSGPTKIEVRLVPGTAIRGRLLGLEPNQLGRVRVSVSASASGELSIDETSGTYRIRGVAPGTTQVRATAQGLSAQAEAEVTIDPGDDEVTLDLDFDAGLTLTGEVVEGGEPLAGVAVRAQNAGEVWAVVPDATTDSAGRFQFRGLQPGEFRVDVHRAGFEGLLASRHVAMEDDERIRVEVAPRAEFAGVVVDAESGDPVRGARIVIVRDPERHLSQLVGAGNTIFTRSDGRFRFTEVPAALDAEADTEPWFLVAARDGFASRSLRLPPEGADDLEVRLERSRDLELTFRSAEGRAPAQLQAQIFDEQGRRLSFAFLEPGAGGRVLLDDLPAGRLRLLLRGDDLVALVEIDPARYAERQLDVLGRPGAVLEVRVPDSMESGREVEIELVDVQGRPLGGYRTRTEDGVLELDGLPEGSFTIRAKSGDRSWSRQIFLASGSDAEVVLD